MTTTRVHAATAVGGARQFIGSEVFVGARTHGSALGLLCILGRALRNDASFVVGTSLAAIDGRRAGS